MQRFCFISTVLSVAVLAACQAEDPYVVQTPLSERMQAPAPSAAPATAVPVPADPAPPPVQLIYQVQELPLPSFRPTAAPERPQAPPRWECAEHPERCFAPVTREHPASAAGSAPERPLLTLPRVTSGAFILLGALALLGKIRGIA